MLFLDTLSNVLCNCNPENSLLLGGDFNCTESILDRNHVEPHMPSQKRLIQLLKTHEIVDVWRNFHGIQRQYTWAHAYDNLISLARLDRFYCFKHSLIFLEAVQFVQWVCLITVCYSVLYLVALLNQKVLIGILIGNLLCDKHFKDIFKEFWNLFRTTKSSFQCLQQWWDVAKVQLSSCVSNILSMSQETLTRSWKQLRKNWWSFRCLLIIHVILAQFDSLNKKKNMLGKY